MAKIFDEFTFTGEIIAPNDSKKLYVENKPYASGWTKHELKIGVKESKSNGMFIKAEALIPPSETHNMKKPGLEKGVNVEFPFNKRNEEVTLDNVADFARFTLDLETDQDVKARRIELFWKIKNIEERDEISEEDEEKLVAYKAEFEEKAVNYKQFVHELDFINAIKENIELLKKSKIRVPGNIENSGWKGKNYVNYTPKSLEVVDPEEENGLNAKIHIFFKKDAVDDTYLKDTGKLVVDGFMQRRDSKEGKDMYFPQQFVIDCSAANFDDEEDMGAAIANLLKSQFDVRGKNYFRGHWDVKVYRGVEQQEFTEAHLTAQQKTFIALKLKTIEDFRPRGGNVNGNNINELILTMPILEGDYVNGAIDTGMNEKDFSEFIKYTSEDDVAPVKKAAKEDPKKEDKPEQADNPVLKGLFGKK